MTTRWIAGLLMTAMSLPAWGQSQPQGRFVLTAGQIAQTLSDKGMQIVDRQVSLLANVVTAEPQPLLDVLSVEPLSGRWSGQHSEPRSLVKLACHLPGMCLPFYAIVSGAGGAAGSGSSSLAAIGNASLKPNGAVTMRAGTHATLVMDDDRAHIQIAVVTLESGAVGHRIRVASPDHKQFYIAEVVSANLLKRSF
jgi:hypothetical protein